MIVLKIIGILIVGIYALWLAVGFFFLSLEISEVMISLLCAPLKKSKEKPSKYTYYDPPLWEQIKEIPGLLKEWFFGTIMWICLPFQAVWVLATSKPEEEQAG